MVSVQNANLNFLLLKNLHFPSLSKQSTDRIHLHQKPKYINPILPLGSFCVVKKVSQLGDKSYPKMSF